MKYLINGIYLFLLGDNMKVLDIYTINNRYINYLQEKEKMDRGFTKISNNLTDKYNNQKPYIGIVLEIGNYRYFAPLTHPKERYDNNSNFFNRISQPIKLKNGKDFGRIMFCYMLPLKDDNVLKRIYINEIEDLKYKSILMTQYFYINSREGNKIILKKANSLYKKVHNNPQHYLYKYCCAFELLEKYSDEYVMK